MIAHDHQRPARTADGPRRKILLVLARLAIGLLIPTLIYYGLRAAGVGVYLSLLASALISAAPTVVGFFRRKVIRITMLAPATQVTPCRRISPPWCSAASLSPWWPAAPNSCWPRRRC